MALPQNSAIDLLLPCFAVRQNFILLLQKSADFRKQSFPPLIL